MGDMQGASWNYLRAISSKLLEYRDEGAAIWEALVADDLGLVNKLYYGDNLFIMREYIPDESVDLIYLDPPFNSKATYNMLFQEANGSASEAQIHAFDDTWHWDMKSLETYEWLVENGPGKLPELMEALQVFLGHNDMLAYLTMMAGRLVEMRRVLKNTGSLYLHCDPTASHYIKLVLDAVFGVVNFKNEIIWRNTNANNNAKRFGTIHQTIFYYSKTANPFFQILREPYLKAYIFDFFKFEDDRGRYRAGDLTGPGVRGGDSGKPWGGYDPTKAGRHWQPASYIYEKYTELTQDDLSKYPLLERLEKMDEVGLLCWNKARTYPSYKAYLDDKPGTQLQDLWSYVPGTKGCIYGSDTEIGVDVKWLMASEKERLGYPTQKPEGLLTRIINSSCPDDGIVLDPFCGCGTTIAVAEKLERKWIGIDLTYIAVNLMRYRLNDAFGERLRPYEVIGVPTDLKSAEALAIEDEHSGRYQFQWWALSLVNARPVGGDQKKGADKGKDGLIRFFDDTSGKSKTIVVSVKSGNVGAKDVRDLIGAVNNSKAQVGCLITLRPSTKAMRDAAVEAGFYDQEVLGKKVQRIQILTVEGLLDGSESLTYHKLQDTTFQQAPKAETEEQKEGLF